MPYIDTSLTTPSNNYTLSLQNLVAVYALNYTPNCRFHNLQIWLAIYTELKINLSYNQIRNALYRLRQYYCIKHAGRGWYYYDIQ